MPWSPFRLTAVVAATLTACAACTPIVGRPTAAMASSVDTSGPFGTTRATPSGASAVTTVAPPPKPVRTSSAASMTPTPLSSTPKAPTVGPAFSLNGAQAGEVATVVEFLDAYNSGDVTKALALFSDSPKVAFSACRYRTGESIDGNGKARVKAWLTEAVEEHSRLVLRSIENANPDQPIGVLGMQISRETSDAITRRGYPTGISPALATKIIFDRSGKILSFASGPFGGPQSACQLPQR